MGVYIVSWALSREVAEAEGAVTWEFRTLLKVAKGVYSLIDAAHAVQEAFTDTAESKEGWSPIGPPAVMPVTDERVTEWEKFIDPPPANNGARPDYLRPVED